MRAAYVVIPILGVLAIAYRYYSAFLAAKVMVLGDARRTPAHTIINSGRIRYVWVTLLPMSFLCVTTLTAGWLSVKNQFWPMAVGPNPALHVQRTINSALTVMMMVSVVILLGAAVRKWVTVGRAGTIAARALA